MSVIAYIALFFASLITIVYCIAVAAIRQRVTLKLLIIGLTAACGLAGWISMGREAARRQSIELLEMQRTFYLEHRSDFRPEYYDELMQELDAEAARLGVDK